jgi:hypothetical protein
MLMDTIDELPRGVEWTYRPVNLNGDMLDDNGKPMTEHLELWYRDPVKVMQELMGNPIFKEVMRFAPERVYCDSAGMERVVNEMWTAEWWWEMQVSVLSDLPKIISNKFTHIRQKRLPIGATIALLILSTDKTKLSQFRGDKSAWPVYLTIGNISKDIRHQASSHATVLIGYIPVGKFDCFTDKTRPLARYQTFHHCMSVIHKSIAQAGKEGINMTCADGHIRLIWPILAAYVADYPEQCLVACCMENRCLICKVHPDFHGAHQPSSARDKSETINMLVSKENG